MKRQTLRMIGASALAAVLVGPVAAAGPVPSEQEVQLTEVLVDEVAGESWIRFRFLAPGIGRATGTLGFAEAEPDMMYLCQEVAIPYLAEYALEGDVIMISMSDKPIEFGAADPDVTQFFDAYRIVDNLCIWEGV